MINSHVQKAVAAALALGAAAGAQAVDISGVAPGNVLYVSGSTAIDGGLNAYLLNSVSQFCDGVGAIDTYAGTATGGKFIAVACTAGPGASPVTAGTAIAVIKEDNAGSLNGITPVNGATAIPFPTISSLTVANCPAGAPKTPVGEQLQTPHSCTSGAYTTANIQPNLGFADVEAGVFGADASNLTSVSTIDIVFAPAVSLGLYHALQQVEGLGTDDTLANMPSLTRGQLTAVFQAGLPWSKVKSNDGTKVVSTQAVTFGNSPGTCWDGTSSNAPCTAPPTVAPSTGNVFICQRGQSSGTQQTTQIFFGDKGCGPNIKAFQAPSTGTCAADGCSWGSTFNTQRNFAGNGTGDLLSCLEAHDQQGHFAIGFASVDNGWGPYQANAARKDFRYIKVDSVVPSIENVASNHYVYWAQSAGYFPASTSASNFPSGVAGQILSAFTTSSTAMGNVGSIKALNPALVYTAPAFDGGFLNIPGNGGSTPNPSSATLATFQGNPVNSYVRGTVSNNCQTPFASTLDPDVSANPTWAGP
jgi:hypothetical protein